MNLDIMLDFANKASDIIANKIVPNTDIIMVVLLIVCGLYYSFLTRFVQFRMLSSVFKILTEKNEGHAKEHISPFQALMISTASRCWYRKYCWNFFGIGYRWSWCFILDVGYGIFWWCLSIC